MTISLFRSIAGQYEHLRSVNTVAMMNTISHEIEDQVINHHMPVDFYACFQRFSYFPEQLRRYGRLGANCRRVYVFGVPDVKPPTIAGIEFVEIAPSSALAREWFVVADTPSFWTALLTQEVNGRDPNGGRRFDGVWTYDVQIVERASLLISQVLGSVYQPLRQRDYEQQSRHIAEINARMIERLERSKTTSKRRWVQLCTLHKFAESMLNNQSPAQVLAEAAKVLRCFFGADAVAIALHQQNDQYEVVVAEGEGQSGGRLIAGAGPSGRAIQEQALVSVSDMRRNRERDLLLPHAQTLIAAPLIGRQQVHGVLAVGSSELANWTEEDQQTVLAIAAMLAALIEQSAGMSDETAQRIKRAEQMEQAVGKLRTSIVQLLDMQKQMKIKVGLSPQQDALLVQMSAITHALARVVGVPRSQLVQAPLANES